jgi:salicylate hydroxylase
MPERRVVVAGGGIGGLVTALALHQRGIEAVVLEQSTQLEAVGAGIQISPNACYVLDKLGLLDALRSHAFEPRSIDITDGRRAKLLISVPLTPVSMHRYGQPYLNVHRGDLHQVLVKALFDRSPDCVLLDSRVESIHQDDTGVEAILADGRRINGNVLVGADGVHSRVRDAMIGAQQPRFTGHVAYRMLVPRGAFETGTQPAPTVTLWMGPHGHVVSYWVRGGELYNVVAIVEEDWREDGWRTPGDIEDVLAAYAGWSPTLRAILAKGTDVYKWALLDREIPAEWSTGRVALLGDACHAMLPYLAQGAAMAIEDAWELAAALSTDAEVPHALSRYQAARDRRARRVQSTAARNGRVYHADSRGPRYVRDTTLRVLGSIGGSAFLARFDWLYDFDVTAPQSVTL